jgi:hypothetical protein
MRISWGWTVGLLFALGCGRKPAPPPHAPSGTPPVAAEAPAPGPSQNVAPEPDPRPDSPVLHLQVNGASFAEVYAGWPVIIRAEAIAPDDREWPLSGGADSVSTLFHLEVRGSGTWSPDSVIQSPSRMSIGPSRRLLMVWVLSPERSAALAAGDYHLTVRLMGTGIDGSWKGSVSSPEAVVNLQAEPKPLPSTLASQKEETAIEVVFWKEGVVKALPLVMAARRKSPHRWQLMVLEGHLQASARKFRESIQAYEDAIAEWRRQNPRALDPPMALLAQRESILGIMRQGDKPAAGK